MSSFTAALYWLGSMGLVLFALWLYLFIKETRAHIRRQIRDLEVELTLWKFKKLYGPGDTITFLGGIEYRAWRQDNYGREPRYASHGWEGEKYELN